MELGFVILNEYFPTSMWIVQSDQNLLGTYVYHKNSVLMLNSYWDFRFWTDYKDVNLS